MLKDAPHRLSAAFPVITMGQKVRHTGLSPKKIIFLEIGPTWGPNTSDFWRFSGKLLRLILLWQIAQVNSPPANCLEEMAGISMVSTDGDRRNWGGADADVDADAGSDQRDGGGADADADADAEDDRRDGGAPTPTPTPTPMMIGGMGGRRRRRRRRR